MLPLDERTIELFASRPAPRTPHPPDRRYVYRPPMSPMPAEAAASVGGRSFDLTARLTRRVGDAGVLWATGTENSGISVFVQDDRLVVDYNAFDDHTVVESAVEVPTGESVVVARIRRTGSTVGAIELIVDDEVCGSAEVPLFMRMISSVGASIGHDHGSAVSSRYSGPFPFSGTLHDLTIQLLTRDESDAEADRIRVVVEMARQ